MLDKWHKCFKGELHLICINNASNTYVLDIPRAITLSVSVLYQTMPSACGEILQLSLVKTLTDPKSKVQTQSAQVAKYWTLQLE